MPNQIENRFLGLRFDNAQFERAAAQSIQTLGKLKESLALKGAETGAENIQKAFSKLSFSTLNNGLNTVTQSFSMLEQIGIGALRQIGAKVEDLGSKIIKNLGLNQFMAGWGKYGNITQSVQTIIAATGKGIDEVTKYTDKLNWFTDETSFSLTDMTNNIAKFTSAGIDLDKAVNQMMGIGNAAALAGAGVEGASHAMSGFSKAMAAGYMSTINWSWIQTSKMDTLAFKQALIDAAVEAGTLKKRIDSAGKATYWVLDGKNWVEVTAENIREHLSTKWLNTAAMEKALSVYGDFSSALSELYQLTGNGSYYTTSELLEYINAFKEGKLSIKDLSRISKQTGVSVEDLTAQFKKLSAASYDTGRKAFAAAQEAITLNQAWEALTDAISTGWMKTFQLLFGNYEEAKKLWTGLANWLYDLFAESGNVRNELLQDWHFTDEGGYKDFIQGLFNIMDAVTSLRDFVKQMLGGIIPEITSNTLINWTKRFVAATGNISDSLARIQEQYDNFINGVGDDLKNTFDWKNEYRSIKETEQRFRNLNDVLISIRDVGRFVKNLFDALSITIKRTFAPAKILADDFLELFGAIGRRISTIANNFSRMKLFKFFGEAGLEGATIMERLVDGLHKFVRALTELIDPTIERSASSFLSTVVEIVKTLWSGIGTIVQTFAPLISSFLSMLKELFGGLAAAFKDFFGEGVKFTDFTNRLKSILDVGILGGIFALFKKLNSIVKEFKGKGIGDIIKELINGKDGNDGMFSTIKKTVSSIGETFKTFTNSISESLAKFTNANALQNFANSIIKIAAAMLIIALIPEDKFTRAALTIAGMIAGIVLMFKAFSKMDLEQAGAIAAIGTAMAGIGTGLLFIAASIIALALIPADKIDQGLHVITVALLELTGVLAVLGQFDAKRMLAAGVSILLISAAMDMITVALLALAFIPANKLLKSVGVLALGLAAISVAVGVLAKLTAFPKKLIGAAASILIVSAAMDMMAVALLALSVIPLEKLAGGVLALVSVIAAVSTALALLSAGNSIGMLAGAAAMLIMAPAILIFTAALAALAFIPFIPLAGGLVILGVALAGIVAAAYLVTPVIPGLLSLAATFVAMGAGAVLLGAGLLAISVAVGAVVLIVAGGVAMIIDALANLINSLRGTMEEGETEAAEGGTGISLSILDAMGTAWKEHVHEIVDNMIAGLKEKVSAAWYRFKEIASSMANAVISGFKSALGIKSPSRVMAEEMGYVIAGMGLGVDRSTNAISDIGESMAQTLLDASDETFRDYTPSLTPVLDMSSVGSGGFSFGATLTPSAVRNLASVSADIRDQRESMNDYITAAVSSAINGMKDELTFVVPLEVDGRQFASSTARFTRSELNLMDRNVMRKGGLINA